MKGQLDEDIQDLGFDQVKIIRPSMLAGDRQEFRWSEKIFTPIMYAFSWIPGIRKYRPIKDHIVAQAMLNASQLKADKPLFIELENIFRLAKNQPIKTNP
jgi:DNA polymerase III psi subunit